MLKRETFAIADIYVPIKRRATLEQKRVDEIAASMLAKGQETPIMVRSDGARFVLVEGLYRLEAAWIPRRGAKALICYVFSLYVADIPTAGLLPSSSGLCSHNPAF